MKIVLREVKLSDASDLRDCVNDKKVIPYLDDSRKYPISLADARKSIQKSIKDKVNYKRAIVVDGKFVGTISLYNPNENKKIFLGLNPEEIQSSTIFSIIVVFPTLLKPVRAII